MQTFSTANPITIEVRNAAGEILIDLTDTDQTSVDVTPAGGHPLGFVDDIVRNLGATGWGPFGAPGGRSAAWADPSSGEPADPLDQVRIELAQRGAGSTLIVDTDPATAGWRSAFTVRITAPARCGVRVQSRSARVAVTGTADRLEVRSASGAVRAENVADGATVQTASGDIRINTVGGTLSAHTASGDVDLDDVGGPAEVQTTSGDVRIGTAGSDVRARTVSGDVRISDAATGTTEVSAVSGDVEVGVHRGCLAAIDLRTLSGSTKSDLNVAMDYPAPAPAGAREPAESSAQRADEDPAGSTAQRADGDPAGSSAQRADEEPSAAGPALTIRIRTTSGDIRLRRAA